MKRAFMGVALALAAAAACSGEDTPVAGGGDGGTGSDASVASDGGGASDAKGGTNGIAAPTLDKIMKMTGGLHVFWSNPTGVTCDQIEGERKTPTTEYKVAFTVPGSVDNKHDATATEKTTYTYRLRCKVGSDYSDYSNEKTGSPQ